MVYPRSVLAGRPIRFGEVRLVEMGLEELLQSAEDRAAGALYASDFSGAIGFADWWYHYAGELGLPLLMAIDDPGLVITGADLDRFERELDRLEACWAELDLSEEPPVGRFVREPDGSFRQESVSFAENLRDGARIVREAIRVAREHDAVLVAG
jgi:hypothetical protein